MLTNYFDEKINMFSYVDGFFILIMPHFFSLYSLLDNRYFSFSFFEKRLETFSLIKRIGIIYLTIFKKQIPFRYSTSI